MLFLKRPTDWENQFVGLLIFCTISDILGASLHESR